MCMPLCFSFVSYASHSHEGNKAQFHLQMVVKEQKTDFVYILNSVCVYILNSVVLFIDTCNWPIQLS